MYLLTHRNWKFEKFVSMKIQTNILEQIQAPSADNVLMNVAATINWRISGMYKVVAVHVRICLSGSTFVWRLRFLLFISLCSLLHYKHPRWWRFRCRYRRSDVCRNNELRWHQRHGKFMNNWCFSTSVQHFGKEREREKHVYVTVSSRVDLTLICMCYII